MLLRENRGKELVIRGLSDYFILLENRQWTRIHANQTKHLGFQAVLPLPIRVHWRSFAVDHQDPASKSGLFRIGPEVSASCFDSFFVSFVSVSPEFLAAREDFFNHGWTRINTD